MKYILMPLLFLCSSTSFSQGSTELISTAGESMTNQDIVLDWSIGEIAIQTYSNTNTLITEGFHQPVYNLISDNEELEFLEIEIFPNPISDILTIKNSSDYPLKRIELYDLLGNRISSTLEKSLDLRNLTQGQYYLRLILENNKTLSYKIIKQ